MSLAGRSLYKIRHHFRHGLVGSWRRERLLPRVLDLPPVTGLTDDRCEIHVLNCRWDWMMLVWTLRTFYRTSGRRYRLCIHEDGSLDQHAIGSLRRQFPEARMILRTEADAAAGDALRGHPLCLKNRAANNLLLKTFDFHTHLRAPRMLLLDSDLLFFASPEALLTRVEDPVFDRTSFNRDWTYGYSIPPETLAASTDWSFVEPLFNSGLGLLHPDSVPLEWCESLFARFPEITSHSHRIEQTLIALCAQKRGHVYLPAEYDVYSGPTDFAKPVRHYCGPFRPRFYAEGIAHVWKHRDRLL